MQTVIGPTTKCGGEVVVHSPPGVGTQRLAPKLFEEIEDHPLERLGRRKLMMKREIAMTQEQTERIGDAASASRDGRTEVGGEVGRCQPHTSLPKAK